MELTEIQKRALDGKQLRFINTKAGQLRAEEVEGEKFIRGYALLWDVVAQPYRDWPDYKEMLAKGALDGVDMSDSRFLVNHNRDLVMGRASKNVRFQIDETGLFVEVKVHNGIQLCKDYYALVKAEFIDGMSFAFLIDKWEYDEATGVFKITKIKDMWEVSVVTFPAYPETVAVAREQMVLNAPDPEQKPKEEKREVEPQADMSLAPAPAVEPTPEPAPPDVDAQRTAELYAKLEKALGGTE